MAELYDELYTLRQQLKDRGRIATGRAPLICSDDALSAIAEMCPKKVEELKSVPGIGTTFIDNYGEAFIEIVKKYVVTETEAKVDLGDKASRALKELEKKLVNINRRNRLLYMPKLASKYGCDLGPNFGEQIENMLMAQSGSVSICDFSKRKDVAQEKLYRNLVSLIREINKDIRDKGQNDLYIGYPYVIGRLPGENFDVRCPLALFPVEIQRTPTSITIRYDEERDALYNTVLLLAYFKFNGINNPLPLATIEEIYPQTFIKNVLNYYGDNGLLIKEKETGIERFKEYSAGEFPKYGVGELQLEKNIIVGKFPIRTSSIQKDFDDIIENGEINNLLNEMLLEVNDWDYESDAYYGDKEINDKDDPYTISEHRLSYINDLDSSQENVLEAINHIDELVIQGPPGTGKSQTITSLIAQFVNDGKTVLLVSEKKTALDVVYSRLGDLSDYALLIDDSSNKNAFYEQLSKMTYLGKRKDSSFGDTKNVSARIDAKISKLEKIATTLYQPDSFGIEPYKVYRENRRVDLSLAENRERVASIHNKIVSMDILMKLTYEQLHAMYYKFSNAAFMDKITYFYDIYSNDAWIMDMKTNLSEFDLLDFSSAWMEYEGYCQEYSAENVLFRLLHKGKLKKKAKNALRKIIDYPVKMHMQLALKSREAFKNIVDQYEKIDAIRPIFQELKAEEREYLKLICYAQPFYENDTLKTNDELYNQLLQEHISIFEIQNRELLSDISDYSNIVRELSSAMSQKKKLTRECIRDVLAASMSNITYAKRAGEIRRIIESKRKWSVNRFLAKYSYEIFNGVKIWLLTPEVVSEIVPLDTGVFDLVIFDEASQMYVEKGLPAVYRAKKVIIAGDHKQLRPSNLGVGRIEIDEEEIEEAETSAALEEESLLDLARFKYQNVMLNFHYRAKYEELIAFSNYAFYHGRLNVSPNVDKPEKPPIQIHMMKDAVWKDRSNLAEAKYVVALLRDILVNRKGSDTIGIITFNSAQRDLIEDLLDEQCALDAGFASAVRAEISRKENGEDIGLFIKNIESVQGDERDIIIFSIGYAKNENGRLVRSFGWLNQKGGENRLNVAISRAKKKIHIITSFYPDELPVEDTKNDGPKYLKKYLQYAKAVSEENEEEKKQILLSFGDDWNPGAIVSFDSEFEMQVYNALNEELCRKGFTVDTQVGIGGYSIDLALKYQGEYVLGIECDGKLYHSSKSARERDYHRQKYLESRGWRIHRIWSTNWWRNPQGEIKKICDLAETLVG